MAGGQEPRLPLLILVALGLIAAVVVLLALQEHARPRSRRRRLHERSFRAGRAGSPARPAPPASPASAPAPPIARPAAPRKVCAAGEGSVLRDCCSPFCGAPSPASAGPSSAEIEAEIIQLTNAERAAEGLPPLAHTPPSTAARGSQPRHARARFFSHENPDATGRRAGARRRGTPRQDGRRDRE